MDGDLGAFMQSVLSDPEQLAKITQMAQGLMGQSETASAAPPSEPAVSPVSSPSPGAAPSPAGGEDRILSMLSRFLASGTGGGKNRSAALLSAMRPYMRPEKQEKLDRAMKLAQMVHVIGAVMGELGGGKHGL